MRFDAAYSGSGFVCTCTDKHSTNASDRLHILNCVMQCTQSVYLQGFVEIKDGGVKVVLGPSLADLLVLGSVFFSFLEGECGRQMMHFCYIYTFLAVAANTTLFCLIEEVGIAGQVAGFSVPSVSWPC